MNAPIQPYVFELIQPLDGITSMLELGNKRWEDREPYKAYFERLGIRHVSVDLNERDGALPLDLRQPLNLGQFDCVTNFGTSEHVSRQEPVWRNIVEACGRLLLVTTPKPGTYRKHGLLYPTEAFYRSLADLNGFTIERLYEQTERRGTNICVRMQRVEDRPFVMPDETLIYRNAFEDRYSKGIAGS